MLERFRRPVTILALDGGGVRGLLSTLILKDLHRRVRELEAGRSGVARLLRGNGKAKPFHRYFDLITGTSTGALVALGLTCPAEGGDGPAYTLEDIEAVYAERGTEIFPRGGFNNFRTVAQAFEAKYHVDAVERLLGDYFGEVTMADALTEVIVPAYETIRRKAYFFKRSGSRNFRMRDVARATSAAPTFFPPALVEPVPGDGREYSFIDGGVFANNPALCGYVEAREIFPDRRSFFVLSLGTGQTNRTFTHEEIRKWGYLDWLSPIHGVPLTAMIWGAQSEVVTHQLQLLPEVEVYRINPLLGVVSEDLDDASRRNLDRIRDLAARIIDTEDAALDRVARLLV